MRKAILVVLLMVSLSFGQEIGGLFVGLNHYIPVGEANHFNIHESGVGFGFLVPIRVPGVTMYFKAKGAHHTVEKDETEWMSALNRRSPVNYFLSASNEFLVGRTLPVNQQLDIIPQIGLGITGEAAYWDWDQGYTHGNIFFDVSVMFVHHLKKFDLGLMINMERDMIDEASPIVSESRLNAVLVIMK